MSVLNFFGGLAQGLGQTVIPLEAEARQREHDKRLQQLDVLHSAYKEAADRGDNEKAAEALNMMAPLLGAKEGKPHPIYAMRDMILNAKPITTKQASQEGLAAQENINNTPSTITQSKTLEPQLVGDSNSGIVRTIPGATSNEVVDNPALKELTRPRQAIEDKILQKGFFPTQLERADIAGQAKAKELEATTPAQLKLYKGQRDIASQIWQNQKGLEYKYKGDLEDVKHENKLEEIKGKSEANALAKSEYTKALIEVTRGNPSEATPEQMQYAQQRADRIYESEVKRKEAVTQMDVARAENYKTLHPDRVMANNTRLRAIANSEASTVDRRTYQQALIEQGKSKIALDERKLDQSYNNSKAITAKLRNVQHTIDAIERRQDHWESVLRNSMARPEDKAIAQQEIDKANKEYEFWQKEHDRLTGEMYSVPSSELKAPNKTITKSAGPANKTLNKPNTRSDPLGIR